MNRCVCVVLLGLLLGVQGVRADEAKPAASPSAGSTWEERHADQPYVVLSRDYEVTLNKDWSYTENYHYRLKVQKDAAKALGERTIAYNKSRDKILDIQAHVETPDGKSYPYTDLQDLAAYDDAPMYSDMRVKVITLPQVTVGSIIDVSVKSQTTRKAMPDQFWDQVPDPTTPTKSARYKYIIPADKPIEVKTFNNGPVPAIEKSDTLVTYTFTYKDTDDVQDEDYMPPYDEVYGVTYLSSMKDWKDMADWYRALVVKNTVDDAQITSKVKELTEGKTTARDKARAILEFLQDNFRYVSMSFGDNTVEPHPSNQIFQNRYGDCKDWSILARQMLIAAGVPADICLFSSEFDGNPQNGLPNVAAFNHVILQVTIDGKKYFVEPQARGYDFGQYPAGYDYAYVLVIEDNGYRFDRLPPVEEKDRTIISKSEITLQPDGSGLIEMWLDLALDVSQQFREAWQANTDNSKQKFYQILETTFTKGGHMIDRQMKGLDNRYGPVSFYLKFESPNAYPVVNDMILLKEEDQANVPEFGLKERKYPIFIPAGSIMQNENLYHVPSGFRIDFVPENYKFSIDFMDLSQEYVKTENTVDVKSLLHIKRATIPPGRYKEVTDLRNEIYKKNSQYVILKKQ